MVFVVFVRADAMPVCPAGAAAAAAAGSAPTSAPQPSPAMHRFSSTCHSSRWNGRKSAYPVPTSSAATISTTRGLALREVTANSTAPTISETR